LRFPACRPSHSRQIVVPVVRRRNESSSRPPALAPFRRRARSAEHAGDRPPLLLSSSGWESQRGTRTLLVAGGLTRRAGGRSARDAGLAGARGAAFHGHVEVHDVEAATESRGTSAARARPPLRVASVSRTHRRGCRRGRAAETVSARRAGRVSSARPARRFLRAAGCVTRCSEDVGIATAGAWGSSSRARPSAQSVPVIRRLPRPQHPRLGGRISP